MSRKRYVVECEWSGYTSAQRRCCHRTVITRDHEHLSKVRAINFTDGTYMSVTVRPALPREKVKELHGYDSLLGKIVRAGLTGHVSVLDVP